MTFLIQSVQLYSQEFAVNFDIGYGLSIATESIPEGYSNSISEYETELINVIYSFGKGININTDIEYFPGEHIGFGVGTGYLFGANAVSFLGKTDFYRHREYSANMFRFFPFIKFKFSKNKLTYYSKMGYLLGAFGEIKRESVIIYDMVDEHSSKTIYNKGISHGAIAAFGIQLSLSNRLSVYSEIKTFIHSYGPKKRELVKSERNGEDRLPELQPGMIHTNYVDNYIKDWSSGGTDFSEPLTELRWFYPFSSIGLNIGIHYKFISKK